TMGIALCLTTGLRIGELCALQWEDVDLKKRILTVRKTIQRIRKPNGKSKTSLIITEPKSESSKRSIPIPECMVKLLKNFKSNPKDFLISGKEKPIEPRTMQYRFAKILKNVNLPSVHFHALRHMFASNCIKLGFDVKALSEIWGHSNVEITLNRYVHSSFAQKQAYMSRVQLNI
ncbi:MAG: site-specific integrase, partial [Ruminococcus sp.]|nr:site-specific integrase [Ruminococcus sp.]